MTAAQTFIFIPNLPLTQFYKVDVDYDFPVYHVVGGTQDNNSQYGPTRTLSDNGIRNSDWRITIGGDGHDCAIKPKDPNIIYCESQEGYLRRFDRKTRAIGRYPAATRGRRVRTAVQLGFADPDQSPLEHAVVLRLEETASQRRPGRQLGFAQWRPVPRAGSLPTADDGPRVGLGGAVGSDGDERYGNITSISESPQVEGLIYVGTDDGLIHVTEDGGKNWRKIDKIFGVPEFFFVNDVKADLHDANTVYACVDNHKHGDYKPYVVVSRDRGQTWEMMTGDLPERHVTWRIVQDHVKPELLFLATEFGVFFTRDGGKHWLKLPGLPNIPVRNLAIQTHENDLVAATFGRGFYVLDDYAPLRKLDQAYLDQQTFAVLPVRPALLYLPDDALGGRRGSQGDQFYRADNPTYGTVFTFYLAKGLETAKQARLKQDQKLKSSGGDTPYPGWEAIKAEDREPDPALLVEIRDAKKNVVRRFTGPVSAGLHRIAWDFRYAPFGDFGTAFAAPGKYSVQFYRRHQEKTEPLGEPQEFDVVGVIDPALEPMDAQKIIAFQREVGGLQQAISAASKLIESANGELGQVRELVRAGRVKELDLLDAVREMELKLLDAQESLFGDPTAPRRFADGKPSISGRVNTALFGTLGQTHGPTKTHREQFAIAHREYEQVIGEVRKVVETDLERLRKRLDELGAPWTPGRKIPQSP